MPWVQWALFSARLITGGLLILAGSSKLALSPASFKRVVQAYRLLPETWSGLVALALPPIEIGVGTMVVLGAFTRLGALLALLILAVVTAAAGSVLARGLKAACGCFGEFTTSVSGTVIARNGVLMALLVPSLLIGGGAVSLDAAPTVRWYVAVAVAVAAALVALLRAQDGAQPRPAANRVAGETDTGPGIGSI